MAITFVVANQKGGIGKTTTATTIAGILGKKYKTLLIDADPQGNSSATYQAKIKDQATLYDVMVDSDRIPLEEAVQHLDNGDIVASDPLLIKAEKLLDGDVEGLYRLKDAIEEVESYDYIIIDTAPALGVVLYNSLIAADRVIIPITADAYSLQGINQLYSTIKAVQKRQNPSLKIEGLLLVKYSGRSNLEKNMLEELKKTAESMGTKLFETKIRECVKTKEAQTANKLLIDYAPNCTTMQDYNELVKEIGLKIFNFQTQDLCKRQRKNGDSVKLCQNYILQDTDRQYGMLRAKSVEQRILSLLSLGTSRQKNLVSI